MSDLLSHLQLDLKTWAQEAQAKGWLNERAVHSIDTTTTATPGSLFDKPNRPLVVGFFGGTGVGKSTLMNRFAQDDIARTSVERPTSREITIYVHESVSLTKLPDEFPMQRMRTQTHQNNQYRSVLWIDMPDFDSVEESNRDLVEHWLPHIDVVVYVVSPDRYRDDNGWRLLLEHGTQHAWLFVINHWDRGDERQREDFHSMLASAGLSNPLLFCTDSSDSANKQTDEFNTFRETVNSLADQQLIDQLESRGVVQRLKQIRGVTDRLREQMSSPEQLAQLEPQWQTHWAVTDTELRESVDWKIPNLAAHYADQEQGFLSSLYTRIRGRELSAAPTMVANEAMNNVLDDAFFDRIDESVDGFAQQATSAGMAIAAVQQPFDALKPEWRQRSRSVMESAIQKSIAAPGTKFQRTLHRMLGWLCWVLPLAAMGWVGFRIINVFRLGANDPAAYLSSNFAIHSLLLLGLAWLVPTLLFIKLKPSREKAAARGARNGIAVISDQIKLQVEQSLEQLGNDQQQRIIELDGILSSGVQVDEAALPEALQRMLIQDPLTAPETGVLATTHS